jgi:hypothetical protein
MRAPSPLLALAAAMACSALAANASAQSFSFSTGNPDGKIAMASNPGSSPGPVERETGDDFVLNSPTKITGATFTGLVRGDVKSVSDVVAEIYRVFPKDSKNPPSGRVPTRVNSPSDVAFDSRDSSSNLKFSLRTLNGNFTAANSVLNGIHPLPNVRTGGEGPVTGTEVAFTAEFTKPFDLPADHYFFVPQVKVDGGQFYWLSAPKPIVAPGTPFTPDLQAWIRDEPLQPDWLRVGTDIVGGTPAPTFNAAFSLSGAVVPEANPLALISCVALLSGVFVWRDGIMRRLKRA